MLTVILGAKQMVQQTLLLKWSMTIMATHHTCHHLANDKTSNLANVPDKLIIK